MVDSETGFAGFEERDAAIPGCRAVRFDYSVDQWGEEEGKTRKMLVVIPTVERNFEILCECPEGEAKKVESDFQKVLDSLRIRD